MAQSYAVKDNQIKPMESINILVSGKTDTELLRALVACITDNDNDMIDAMRKSNYSEKTKANVEVLAAIVDFVNHKNMTVGYLSIDNLSLDK